MKKYIVSIMFFVMLMNNYIVYADFSTPHPAYGIANIINYIMSFAILCVVIFFSIHFR